LLANEESPVGAASYQRVADQLLAGDWWRPRRIFITSPTAGDGKTCTAFNLASALNARGASVLLVELNFMRPRFGSFLGGLQIRFGVDCAIRRLANPEDSVISIGSKSLGMSPVKNAMRVAALNQHQPQLSAYLNWGSNNFDWLILDCPAVLSSAWNGWFRTYARPAMLLVRERHTPAIQVRRATDRLGVNLKGVLMNDVVNSDRDTETIPSSL
jgi:Mrp family chromosome partitioning ATPase